MEQNKKKTVKQTKKHYKTISNLCFGGEFVSIILPFFIIAIVNFDDYFVQYDGWKMGTACVLTIALMFMAIWLTAKKKFEGSYIVLVLGWATATIIFFLLGTLITDIAYIMLFGLIGLVGAYALDKLSKYYSERANEVDDAIKQARKEAYAKEYTKEQTDEDGDFLG